MALNDGLSCFLIHVFPLNWTPRNILFKRMRSCYSKKQKESIVFSTKRRKRTEGVLSLRPFPFNAGSPGLPGHGGMPVWRDGGMAGWRDSGSGVVGRSTLAGRSTLTQSRLRLRHPVALTCLCWPTTLSVPSLTHAEPRYSGADISQILKPFRHLIRSDYTSIAIKKNDTETRLKI